MLAWFFLRQKCVDYLSVLVGFEENGKAIFMKSPRGRPALPSQEAQEVKLSLSQTDDVLLIVANALCLCWLLGTSVQEIGPIVRMEQAFLRK